MPDRGDRTTQRAVLSFLLDEFPARHTMISLWWMGLGDLEEVEESIRLLDLHGLLWREGQAVTPTATAPALRLAGTVVSPALPSARL